MSWLEKSAGIVMSEIILGNAGVCCKGPGKRQFITSVGSDTQPAHIHTDTATAVQCSPPPLLVRAGVGGLPPGREGVSAWLGAHLVGEGAREPGLELRLPGVPWCHQIQELGPGFLLFQYFPSVG